MQAVNYLAYMDISIPSSSALAASLSEFQIAGGQEIIFGLNATSTCTSLSRIVDLVCPALRDCTIAAINPTQEFISGILVMDFDTEFGEGDFSVVAAAYQAFIGQCGNVKTC